jgi:hypothetical protein
MHSNGIGPTTSRHFSLQQIADGVHAAIDSAGAGAMSNAGIVDLDDVTLVFDTFMTPQAAADLRITAPEVFPRNLDFLRTVFAERGECGWPQETTP